MIEHSAKPKLPINWHIISRKGILISKLIMFVLMLCIAISISYNSIITPYVYFIIGIEISIALIVCFVVLRMNTFIPAGKPLLPNHFNPTEERSKLLWLNITYDINRYEEGSSYYFTTLLTYKYSTIILSGISTVILGLSLSDIKIGFMDYTTFSRNAALVIGAFITVYTTLITFWNVEKYWLINKTIVNRLRTLRDELEDTYVSGTLNSEKVNDLVKKHIEIKDTFNKYWEGTLSERNSQSEKK